MTLEPAASFDFADFDSSLDTPWRRDVALRFDDRLRRAWRAIPDLEVATDVSDGDAELEYDDEGEPLPYVPWCRRLAFTLGTVRSTRRYVDGEENELAGFDLDVSIEPGPWSELRRARLGRYGTALWNDRLEALYERALDALLAGEYPPRVTLPAPGPRPCTAAALVAEGWATRGAEVRCRGLDALWSSHTRVRLDAIRAAIAQGEGPYVTPTRAKRAWRPRGEEVHEPWGLAAWADGGVRLVFPLAVESITVTLVGHDAPGVLSARYFLAIDLEADGTVADVTVRMTHDGTFDMEDDDAPARFAEREGDDDDLDLLTLRLEENAYHALSWVVEVHAVEEDAVDDAPDDRADPDESCVSEPVNTDANVLR
jgi:hypothetical protein